MRVRLAAGAAALAAAVLAPVAAGADTGLRLVEAGGSAFPDRAYILTLPQQRALTAADVRVRENGDLVAGATLDRAGAAGAGKRFAVVLAVDASTSMRGRPLEKAMAAARAFALRTDAYQELAAVAFNDTTRVLLPFSDDVERIQGALSVTPKVEYWTRMYEALDRAIALVRDARFQSASIVLLSDGQELGSAGTLEGAVERARKAGVRVFGVGLDSRFFDATALRRLAEGTGGRYLQADSPDDLKVVFGALGAQLAREYLLRYRSAAAVGTEVKVSVEVDGAGLVTSGYRTPAAPADGRGVFEESLAQRVLQSPVTAVVVGVLVAALLAAAVAAAVRTRRSTLRERMSEFVSQAPPARAEGAPSRVFSGRLIAGTERSLGGARWWARLKRDLEIADLAVTAPVLALWTLIGTFAVAWVVPLATRTPLTVVFAAAVPLAARGYVQARLARKRRAFAEQLPDDLDVVASALRAGHSLVGALSRVADDAAEPSRSEFRRVVADERLGVPLEMALASVVERMRNRDLDQVALVARVQRETGGNAAEVLDRVTESIRSRDEVRRLVRTLTAQGRLSRWVLSLIPVVLLLFLSLVNWQYMEPLFVEPLGRALLVVATVMVVAGSLIIKRIVDIEI